MLPVRLAKLVKDNPDKISECFYDELSKDYWLHLKDGWICTAMECGTIHEYTVKDVIRMFKYVRKADD